MPHIVILGGGISGLATGWFLRRHLGSQIQLTILEKSDRPGGWIETIEKETFLFEQGPRSCRTAGSGKETLALVEALGLEHRVIAPAREAKNRYVFHGNSLHQLPSHVWQVPFNVLTKGWLKALWRDWTMPKIQRGDESIHSFFTRHIGASLTERLIDPMVSGIYAGDCHLLSLKSCFPLFDQWQRQQGSLIRGAWFHRSAQTLNTPFIQRMSRFAMFSFQKGMETLPRALALELKDHLLLNQQIKRIKCERSGLKLELSDGKRLHADHVISTLPTFALSALLQENPMIAAKLGRLAYATVISVNMGFHQNMLPYQGFGYLIPSQYRSALLGCVWDSSVFPQQNRGEQTRLTVMMGGTHHPAISEMSDSDLVELAQKGLHDHLGIRQDPGLIQIKRAIRAIPQFRVGFSEWKRGVDESIHQLSSDLTLSGSAWTGVSINDCIAHANELAQKIAKNIEGSRKLVIDPFLPDKD